MEIVYVGTNEGGLGFTHTYIDLLLGTTGSYRANYSLGFYSMQESLTLVYHASPHPMVDFLAVCSFLWNVRVGAKYPNDSHHGRLVHPPPNIFWLVELFEWTASDNVRYVCLKKILRG